MAATQRARAANSVGRARLYRGAACGGADRPRRIRPHPIDIGAGKTVVPERSHTAARPGDRRAVHVLSDTSAVRSRIDLAAQPDAANRPGVRAATPAPKLQLKAWCAS